MAGAPADRPYLTSWRLDPPSLRRLLWEEYEADNQAANAAYEQSLQDIADAEARDVCQKRLHQMTRENTRWVRVNRAGKIGRVCRACIRINEQRRKAHAATDQRSDVA